MIRRTLQRSIFDLKIHPSILPPTFLLPSRARYFNSTAQIVEPPTDSIDPTQTPPTSKIVAPSPSSIASNKSNDSLQDSPISSPQDKTLDPSVKRLLPFLRAQPSHYITAQIHGRSYLLTRGDTVRLPFLMPKVEPGDVLRLNRATNIGSRDYTLQGSPYIDERLFECRATVLGTESEPVRVKEKTKRRNRRVKTVRSKHKFTMLRISELNIRTVEDIENESGS